MKGHNWSDTQPPQEENSFLSINLGTYRKLFYQAMIPLATAIIISLLIVTLSPFDFSFITIKRIALPVMAILAVLAFVHSGFQKKKMKRLNNYSNFDQKAEAYQKIYRLRLFWFLISGFTCCFIYLFSLHKIFILFAIFDALLLISNFPNKKIFERELNNDEIIFY
jgi:hypothetical protein